MNAIDRRIIRVELTEGGGCVATAISRWAFWMAGLLLPGLPIMAQAPEQWTAQWITADGAPARDAAVLHFRKRIELPVPPGHFVLHVSADPRFVFFVNGHRVRSGPASSDPAHWRYETFDVAPYLRAGRNVLAATVWNFGIHSTMAEMSERTAFLVQGHDALSRMADTNPSWEAEVERGQGPAPEGRSGLGYSYYAGPPGERVDGASCDWTWKEDAPGEPWKPATFPVPGFGAWSNRAVPQGAVDAPNAWALEADPLPPMSFEPADPGRVVRTQGIPASDFPRKSLEVPAHAQISLLLDRGSLTCAYPELIATGGQGARIEVGYAEALVDAKGAKGHRDRIDEMHLEGLYDVFLPGGGAGQAFSPLNWRVWRYLELRVRTGDEPLRLEGLRAFATGYPFNLEARFDAGRPDLARIWDVGWRTARLDAHETYMDCPYWERLQYIADARPQMLLSYALTGDDRLARQALLAFRNSIQFDGLPLSRYPTQQKQVIAPNGLFWVSSVHDFWRYRRDDAFVRELLVQTRPCLDWFLRRVDATGLLGLVPGWNFLDWSPGFSKTNGMPPEDKDGHSTSLTLLLACTLMDAAELESALGEPRLAESYRLAARRASKAVWETCWNPGRKLMADTPAQASFSQHASILAILAGAVPEGERRALMHRLVDGELAGQDSPGAAAVSPASFYFRFYLARALQSSGEGELYLSLLGPWKRMLALGLSTWAEQPEPTRSDCHAWSAHPDYDFLNLVAGIQPLTPGFRTVRIAPCLGQGRDALDRLDAVMAHPDGRIRVHYERLGPVLEAEITLPPGVQGRFEWRGRSLPLHEGLQQLRVEPNVPR